MCTYFTKFRLFFQSSSLSPVDRDSVVGIKTRYGLEVPGSNPGRGEIFRTCPDRPWGPPSLLYNRYRVFPGGKAAGAWRWPPIPSSAEVKEGVELYLSLPPNPFVACSRVNFTFTIFIITKFFAPLRVTLYAFRVKLFFWSVGALHARFVSVRRLLHNGVLGVRLSGSVHRMEVGRCLNRHCREDYCSIHPHVWPNPSNSLSLMSAHVGLDWLWHLCSRVSLKHVERLTEINKLWKKKLFLPGER